MKRISKSRLLYDVTRSTGQDLDGLCEQNIVPVKVDNLFIAVFSKQTPKKAKIHIRERIEIEHFMLRSSKSNLYFDDNQLSY